MPSRGSGIGAGFMAGLGTGGVGGSQTSTRSAAPGQVYGPQVAGGRRPQTHSLLLVLVLAEALALFGLRHLFRRHHGG